jgi:hypothetical protein
MVMGKRNKDDVARHEKFGIEYYGQSRAVPARRQEQTALKALEIRIRALISVKGSSGRSV